MFGRADFIANQPDTIKLLQSCGLKSVFVGIESFKESELSAFNKRTSVETNSKATHFLDSLGIECYSGIIIGTDWEQKDFDFLIRFLNTFKMPLLNIQPITPIPGTPLYDTFKNKIIVPREQHHLWDMTHILLKPTKMSTRRFYYNIIRTYYKTATGLKGHVYVFKKYGFRIYVRTISGVFNVTWQYIKLIIKSRTKF